MAALTENYAANLVAQTLIILRGPIIDNNIKLRISKNSKRAILSSVLRINFFFSLSTFFSQNLDFRTWILGFGNHKILTLGIGAQKVVAACFASSGGHSTLLFILIHIYERRLTFSLGCTFCTWHFTSSSSVKGKLKTIPEEQDLKLSFFSAPSWFFSTHNNIDEISLMVFDWLCYNQVEKHNWKINKFPLHSFFRTILMFKYKGINGVVSKSYVRARLKMRSSNFKRYLRGA